MSIVCANKNGWLVDTCSLIDHGLKRCIKAGNFPNEYFKYCFKKVCFQTVMCHFSPRPTSSADGGIVQYSKANNGTYFIKPTGLKRRKRKRSELNQGEIDSLAYHEKIKTVIAEGTKSLVESVVSCGYLNIVNGSENEPLPSQVCNLATLSEMAKTLPLPDDDDQNAVQFIDSEDISASHLDIFTQVTENVSGCAISMKLMGEDYVIPPQCAFLLSDFTRIQPLVNYGKRFDLIVLDPPWENKSVKRSGRYNSLPSTQLKRLPVPLMASPGCLVVTWVTNRPSHLRYVREELYPHWGVEVQAEWFWVKVTQSGEFVFPLDSQHKKPYEVLVLGRYRGRREDSASSSETSEVPVEDHRIIISVPSRFHSHKPSLSEVLKPYTGAQAKCLELFARSLQPGWTSWGNEVIKFQHTSYFTVQPSEDPKKCHYEPSEKSTNQGPGTTLPPIHTHSPLNQ